MKIKLIDYGYTNAPKRAHDNDAGADVYVNKEYTLGPNETIKIPLGFGLELPDGYMGLIFPRSSLATSGIVSELPPIDSGYNGEIHAIITNTTNRKYIIKKGMRVAQLVILPIVIADFVSEAGEVRGVNGFGSTGV